MRCDVCKSRIYIDTERCLECGNCCCTCLSFDEKFIESVKVLDLRNASALIVTRRVASLVAGIVFPEGTSQIPIIEVEDLDDIKVQYEQEAEEKVSKED